MDNRNQRKSNKITYQVAMKETLSGALDAVTTGKVFSGFKEINGTILDKIKKVFSINTEAVIMREAQPHLKMAIYINMLSIVLVQVVDFLLEISGMYRNVLASTILTAGLATQLAILFFMFALFYMAVSNKKIWNTLFVKFLMVLCLIGLLNSVRDLVISFKILTSLKYGFSRIGSVATRFSIAMLSSLLSMYAEFMVLYALTFVKGAKKSKKSKEEETFNVIEETKVQEEPSIVVPLEELDEEIDLFGVDTEVEKEPVIESRQKFCSNCGVEVKESAVFCSECGTKL